MALTEAQVAKRPFTLGASDISAVVGVSPYKTALDVWNDKVHGRKPAEQRLIDAAYWGDALEPVIRNWYRGTLGEGYKIAMPRSHIHPVHEWASATPDGVVQYAKAPVWGLEIKNRSYNDKARWTDHVACEVAAQCFWGMYVTGLKRWDAAVLLNGNTPVVHTLVWDSGLINAMVSVCSHFWRAVQDKVGPEMEWVEQEVEYVRGVLVNDADEAAFRKAAYWRKREGK